MGSSQMEDIWRIIDTHLKKDFFNTNKRILGAYGHEKKYEAPPA